MHDPPSDDELNAMLSLMAMFKSGQNRSIAVLTEHLPKIVERLKIYDLPSIAAPLAGLLTRPELQPAWYRIEMLIHLAVVHSRGHDIPSPQQVIDLVNELTEHPLSHAEDPSEDVFVGNVGCWIGNARVLNGGWSDNDAYLQSLVATLNGMNEDWVDRLKTEISALLLMAEKIAERRSLKRNLSLDTLPRKPINVPAANVMDGLRAVVFSRDDLREHGIARHIKPFLLPPKEANQMADKVIGSCALDRMPIVATAGYAVFALPTAASVAARQHALKTASEAGNLDKFSDALASQQFTEILRLGLMGWRLTVIDPATLGMSLGEHELICTFDTGSYAHVYYMPGDLQDILNNGVEGPLIAEPQLLHLPAKRAQHLTRLPDFRRGMTLMIGGGLGGQSVSQFDTMPDGWTIIAMPFPEFMLLANDRNLDAKRAWKLQQQVAELPKRGFRVANMSGFMNVYAWASKYDFALVPPSASSGVLQLQTNFNLDAQQALRSKTDIHMTRAPKYEAQILVQRGLINVYPVDQDLPIYTSSNLLASGHATACVEPGPRPWWLTLSRSEDADRIEARQIWEMALIWLLRVAESVEEARPDLAAAALSIDLVVDKQPPLSAGLSPLTAPDILISDGNATIHCSPTYLSSFRRPENIGDRMMVRALAEVGFALSGKPATPEELDELVDKIVPNDHARFVHVVLATDIRQRAFAATPPGPKRLVSQEDRAWAELGLAKASGWARGPGAVPGNEAKSVLMRAVDTVWQRVRTRLLTLDRTSVVLRGLRNFEALEYDRMRSRLVIAAQMALVTDKAKLAAEILERETRRSVSAIGSRVLVEMAICTCPENGGQPITEIDLDYFLAELSLMVDCAGHSDAVHYDMSENPLLVFNNGSFGFDNEAVLNLQSPYIIEYSKRSIDEAVADYGEAYTEATPSGAYRDPRFYAAIEAEFGIPLVGLVDFAEHVFEMNWAAGRSIIAVRKKKVLEILSAHGSSDPEKTYRALTLMPRERWDEDEPVNATKRDWYPWRFGRRLSVTRRPVIQLGSEANPKVLLSAGQIGYSMQVLISAYDGELPVGLFDSAEMRSWIGIAANREGEKFEKLVSERLTEMGFKTIIGAQMPRYGGPPELGDVDVLAWQEGDTTAHIIECKNLIFARTIGEFGERLQDFSTFAPPGRKKTAIQKHVNRIDYLRANPAGIAQETKIPVNQLRLNSVLLTDVLVPMQFSKKALQLIDLVLDITQVKERFGSEGKY